MKACGHVFKYGDNVDTDVIIPARYLNATKGEELAVHCMEDIDKDFVNKVQKGDIMASIAVRDTGIGLTKEEARMVFSRFWRADAGRNRESGGLGVGLAVVKELAELHGGSVSVASARKLGSTFTVRIPYVAVDTEEYDEEDPADR